MEYRQLSKALRFALSLAVVALLCGGTIKSASHRQLQSTSASRATPPQQISPESRAALQAIIQTGNLPDLRWPNFSDYTKHLQKFYDAYGYALPWVRGMQPSPQALQIIALIQQAEEKGLSPDDYDAPRWAARLARLKPTVAQPTEADALRFDVALTVCVMRYISDLHIGKVNPKHFDFGLDVETKKYDLPDFLKDHVVDGSDVTTALAQVEPPYPGYRRTLEALHTYLALAKHSDDSKLPVPKKTIAPGDTYAGISQLAQKLRLVGDLPDSAVIAPDTTVYQGPLVDAIKTFQQRHGRDPDGRIGAQTLADLNVPLAVRVRQMQLTLERWRWLPLAYGASPIVANIPEFRLRAYDEKFKVALTMNVVVGKAYDHDTPIFVDRMEYLVFRPYWSVPYAIARAEFFSRIARDPDYLEKKGFEVVDSRQKVVASGAVSSELLEQLRAGKLFIRQKPGPKNSLGLLKFIFPNNFNIYMHDTPEQEFFSRSRRDFSHGCIRLERPADLAAFVLRNNSGWDMDRIRAAMKGDTTQQVNLARPIPVLILYGTVIVPEDGLVHFYDDIYGHDAALNLVLQQGYPYPG
ncbi:MAG TPA: L,D-transpeptidase family protein [Candidatus Acidoferrales bacterium]|nr:L,D-transpeptidase family protein [Candidatus Acidoferrales bacterium]